MLPALLALALQAGAALPAPAKPPAAPAPTGTGPVILFLIDNSASLPPLDPNEKRVVALEKMFTFLKGQRYRLVLFGGRKEVFVDDPSKYKNDGQWTDFYQAFAKAKQIAAEYPPGTEMRMVLLTDAIPDPDPADWPDVPKGWDARSESVRRSIALLTEMRLPLYVVLVGEPPGDAQAKDPEQSPGFVLDMVRAANGRKAAPLAQSIASFFADDGLLLRKFVYRVAPQEGLQKIEPVVRRIAAPPRAGIELRIFSYVVLPLTLFLVALLGILVRAFPGPGDVEVVELAMNQPVHVAVDRTHRSAEGLWSEEGLSLAADARGAAATFTLQLATLEENPADAASLDPRDAALLPLPLEELRRALEAATDSGSREEKIHALNLDYAARSLQPGEVARIVTPGPRGRVPAIDLVRAKVRLCLDEPLRRQLLEPRVLAVTYGKGAARSELGPGSRLRLGRYGFAVAAVEKGGRKDARLHLRYDRVPSLLGLKTIFPGWLQRVARLRRSDRRLVS
jgi:hypothetical protein